MSRYVKFSKTQPFGFGQIKKTMWNFNRLPPEKKTEVRDLYEAGEVLKILDIYNEWRVSPDFLLPCCNNGIQKVKEWTNWAIHNGEL